jgi:hypothetical protein
MLRLLVRGVLVAAFKVAMSKERRLTGLEEWARGYAGRRP